MKRLIPFVMAAMAALTFSGAAAAQSCLFVEWRVNQQTAALDAAVAGQIGTSQAGLLAVDLLNRSRLLSALRTLTAQQSASADQMMLTETQAAEAAASAVVAQDRAHEVARVQDEFSSTGYRACGLVTKASSFHGAVAAAPAKRGAILGGMSWQPGQTGSQNEWVQSVGQAGGTDANVLFDGSSEAEQARYISLVMGPPPSPPTDGAGGDISRIDQARRDALKSTSAYVLASIGADYAPDGPIDRMRSMTGHWLGDDGGEQWTANMADQSERGVLQDAVRLEAANLASLAFALKSNVRQEAVTAGLLLARINAILGQRP